MSAAVNSQILWYLSRGTGIVTLALLSLTLVLGVTSRRQGGWLAMPRFVVAGLHRNLALLVCAFVSVHIATAIIDPYAGIHVVSAFVPFTSSYRPLWVGLGAVALDVVLAVVITSVIRVRLGVGAWRTVHWLVYPLWPVTVAHALGAGSDVRTGILTVVAALATALVAIAAAARLYGVFAPPAPVTAERGLR